LPSGLGRQCLDLAGDHREALAGIARARRFDRCVEREENGPLGNVLNEMDDFADPVGGAGQPGDRMVGALHPLHRFLGNLVDWATWRAISFTDAASSSAAAATVWALEEALSIEADAVAVLSPVAPAIFINRSAVARSSSAAVPTAPTMPPTELLKSELTVSSMRFSSARALDFRASRAQRRPRPLLRRGP
jgi:hypothetical protein